MAYTYTGSSKLAYFKYLDLQTGHTLVADPGGQYEMTATEAGLAVPPSDGRWIQLSPLALSAPPSPAPVSAPVLLDDPGEEPAAPEKDGE